jgi:hypothetical protein
MENQYTEVFMAKSSPSSTTIIVLLLKNRFDSKFIKITMLIFMYKY